MAENSFQQTGIAAQDGIPEKRIEWTWHHLLPGAALAIYLFTPILIWQLGLPDALKDSADLLVIAMIALSIAHMFTADHIPGYFLVILMLTITGVIVASFEGQALLVTVWGWWMMFRFPMVGLFAYLLPNWPKRLAAKIPQWLLYLLALQVAVQFLLYLSGVRDFDNLAGTFGRKGVGAYILFIVIVIAVALGKWLVKGEWKMLVLTLALSSFASALGEMKFFIIAAPMLAGITLGIHLLRGGQIRKLIVYIIFFLFASAAFIYGYDRFIVQNLGRPPLEEFLNEDRRQRYLENVRGAGGEQYRLGRNTEAEYGWQLIQRDTATLFFGYGLGTRQNSPQLGIVGVGLEESLYGDLVGRTLLVMMYEMGLTGLLVMLAFVVFSAVILYRAASRSPDDDLDVLRYGVILFTMLWPFLIWYKSVWLRVEPMLIYWLLWGYIMHFSIGPYYEKTRLRLLSRSEMRIRERLQ
jgi:hypothetical protein